MDLSYFNPHSQNESDFLAGFVARREALDFLLKQLRLASDGTAARHHLIIAPRGYGKTSLLRRIAIAVRSEDELKSRFIALTFREEQHNVISLDVFWRNCLQSLIEAREDEGADQQELDAIELAWTHHAPRQALGRDAQDGEPAWAALRAFCEQLKRRPVLLIDNLDTLLEGLGAQHQWGLRRRLQDANGPLMIAAASRYPTTTQDPKAAFYDFFRIQTLDRLDDRQVMACLRNIAAHRGDAGKLVLNLLDRDPGRVAALNTLAGGNPRTLSVLYSVLESHMSADLLSQLGAMLDTFTGWYQARTEELPMQARAVFDALALNWDPMTAAALGQATGLDTPSVSSQLTRLEKSGYVETVPLSRGKGRSGFQVSERFFNIWYLMRNGPRRAKQSIRFLTVFLQSCFTADERRSFAKRALGDSRYEPGYTLALASSLRDGPLRHQLLDQAYARSNEIGQLEEFAVLIDGLRNEKQGRRKTTAADALPEDNEARILFFDKLISQHGSTLEATHFKLVANSLVGKAMALGSLGRSEQEIQVYDEVVARFGTSTEPTLREEVVRALFNKGFTLTGLGRLEQGIEAYGEVLARFGTATEPALRKGVARALVNKGMTLGTLGRPEQEIEVYDQVVARFGTATEPALREGVASALVNKGITLGNLGRSDQAIEVFDQTLARFGADTEPALREQVARALVNKGVQLGNLGRSDQAVEVYAQVLARFGTASEPALREGVARALVNNGITLGSLGRSEQAVEMYDQVVARFGAATESALREQVAKALVNKGFRLGNLGRSDQAIDVFDQVLARFGGAIEPALGERTAIALIGKGFSLGILRRWEDAIEVYNQVLARFGTATETTLRELVAIALDHKAKLLVNFIGDPVGAREAYEGGLAFTENQGIRTMLHSNIAYTLALHLDDRPAARTHAAAALADAAGISAAGRALLEVLPIWHGSSEIDWPRLFEGIGKAITSEDSVLWTAYADDLQRLLWFVIAKGEGARFKTWMEEAQYPNQYAPLYHAFVAALEGEDHLLRINPETRQPASSIHAGIARLQKLYGSGGATKDRVTKKRPSF